MSLDLLDPPPDIAHAPKEPRASARAVLPTEAAPPAPNDVADSRRRATEVSDRHRKVWQQKPILRELYHDWYQRMARFTARVEGPTVELGGGPGTLKSFFRDARSSDIAFAPWLDFVGDATRPPLADGSVANLIMVDLLHHLPCPQRCFARASRILKPGGRIIILDVSLTGLSWPVYHFLHPEPATLSIRPLDHGLDEPLFDDTNPWSSDQGMAEAIFWKQRARFEKRFPQLDIVHRESFHSLLWPLSGGFDHTDHVPAAATRLLWRLERALERWGRHVGFRCLVVLERTGDASPPDGGAA